MEIDWMSAGAGAVTTGSVLVLVVKWFMGETSAMRKWLQEFADREAAAKAVLATAMNRLTEAVQIRVEWEKERLRQQQRRR